MCGEAGQGHVLKSFWSSRLLLLMRTLTKMCLLIGHSLYLVQDHAVFMGIPQTTVTNHKVANPGAHFRCRVILPDNFGSPPDDDFGR